MSELPMVRTVTDLRRQVARWRGDGLTVGFTPTMGALHEGHLSLVKRAKAEADRVIASVFVNPTQFGPGEDLDAYPRDEAGDSAKLFSAGCDLLFAPAVGEMYPEGFATSVRVSGLTDCLCGASRPGHFDGVATVVSKLLGQARPDIAVFGEKDYQQSKVIERMVEELMLDIRIVRIPTVREPDGLALSSRNAYLDPCQRRSAPALYSTMIALAARLNKGDDIGAQCEWGCQALLDAGFDSVDYFEIRDAETLYPATANAPNLRIFAAARLGDIRLIDNMPVDPPK